MEVEEDSELKVDLPIDLVKHDPRTAAQPNELFSMRTLNSSLLVIRQEVPIDSSLKRLLSTSPQT